MATLTIPSFFGRGGGGNFHFDFFGGGGGRPRTPDARVQFKVALKDIYTGAQLRVRCIPPSTISHAFRLKWIVKRCVIFVMGTVPRIQTMSSSATSAKDVVSRLYRRLSHPVSSNNSRLPVLIAVVKAKFSRALVPLAVVRKLCVKRNQSPSKSPPVFPKALSL